MINISRKAISITLEETVRLCILGQSQDYSLNLIKRKEKEDPHLIALINVGYSLIDIPGMDGKIVRAAYRSGSEFTIRMFEAQVKIDNLQLPKIEEKDIENFNKHAREMKSLYGDNALAKELDKMRDINPQFGSYVITYVKNSASNKMVVLGFSMGVITVHSVYEEAFNRLNK